MAPSFKNSVITLVKAIPAGKIASYGQIASYAGSPRAARQVGGILQRYSEELDLPWWRVINNTGRISIKNPYFTRDDQATFLKSEGVEVSEGFVVEIERYRCVPSDKISVNE